MIATTMAIELWRQRVLKMTVAGRRTPKVTIWVIFDVMKMRREEKESYFKFVEVSRTRVTEVIKKATPNCRQSEGSSYYYIIPTYIKLVKVRRRRI